MLIQLRDGAWIKRKLIAEIVIYYNCRGVEESWDVAISIRREGSSRYRYNFPSKDKAEQYRDELALKVNKKEI